MPEQRISGRKAKEGSRPQGAAPRSTRLSKRGAGTARRRNSEHTKRRILDAAEASFAAKGYAGTRVQSIADRARVNKRMLYHYFGNKRGLYAAVAEERFQEILEPTYEQGRRALETAGPVEALRTVISVYFDALRTHPRYTKFIGWEAVAGWPLLNELEPGALNKIHDLLVQIFREGAANGVLDPDLDPEAVWPHVITVIAFYFHVIPRAQLYTSRDLWHPTELERAKQQIINLIIRGIEARPAPLPPGTQADPMASVGQGEQDPDR